METAADVDNPEWEIYDPYYVERMSTATDWATPNHHRFFLRGTHTGGGNTDTGFNPAHRWGIIFRIRFDLDAARSGDGTDSDPYWENWCKNTSQGDETTAERAFVIYFEKSAIIEHLEGWPTDLKMGELR